MSKLDKKIGIDKISESLKKKMTLRDHNFQENHDANTSEVHDEKKVYQKASTDISEDSLSKTVRINHDDKNLKNLEPSKEKPSIKMTVYLTPGSKRLFDEIYAKRILSGNKTEISALFNEAIDVYYEHECAKQPQLV